MEDSRIVMLYWQREEQAVAETARKYERYCMKIALRLLGDPEDARECVNDAYQGAWDSIPPNCPENLAAYLGKITRRLCMVRWRERNTQKRGCGELPLSLEELGECIPDGKTLDEKIAEKELVSAINHFLQGLSVRERQVFVLRYWHGYSIREIGERCGFSKSKVESMLYRTRQKLKNHLRKEGLYEG